MHGPKNKIGILSLKDLWAVLKKKIFMNVTEIWDYPTFVLDCYSMELFKIDDPSTLNLVPGLKLAVTLCVQYTVGMWRAVPCQYRCGSADLWYRSPLRSCFLLYNTRVGTLIVATIYLQLIQNRYMFRSFTVLQCSHQHCVQPVASDMEVVGYL